MTRKVCILVAEDEETDVILLRHAFRKAGLAPELIVREDGKGVIDYLSREVSDAHQVEYSLPSLVLLDLKMPRLTGFDVLTWLKSRPEFKEVPAVVLTSSHDESDRQRALELGAADYVVKPGSVRGLVEVVQNLQAKWLATNT